MTYPLLGTTAQLHQFKILLKALENRLDAIARKAGKGVLDARMTKAWIFLDLGFEQSKLISPRMKFQREMRNWRAGPISSDWAAMLVRKASLRMGVRARHSEAKAIAKASTNVNYSALTSIEKRAADMVTGRRRASRSTPKDPAIQLARAVRREWLRPVAPLREKRARTPSIDTIVRIALPHLDALANGPIRGGTPDNEHDVAKMEPPALGALLAIARMAHPKAGHEYICDMIRKSREAVAPSSN